MLPGISHNFFFLTKKKYYLVVCYAIPQLLVSFILMGGLLAFCFLMDVKSCRGRVILHSLDSFLFGKKLVESHRLRGRKETVAVE